MGLNTSHGCWDGSYTWFCKWRDRLAEAAGYEFEPDPRPWDPDDRIVMLPPGSVTDETLMGVWDETPEDPLVVLLAHSDCDGDIYPAQAVPLADRLEEIKGLLPDDEYEAPSNTKNTTQWFIEGLRRAASRGEVVVFG